MAHPTPTSTAARRFELLRTRHVPVAVLLAGVAASAAGAWGLWSWQREEAEQRFATAARATVAELVRSLDGNLEQLHSVQAFYEASERVEAHEFASFVKGALERHPALRELTWIVPREPLPGVDAPPPFRAEYSQLNRGEPEEPLRDYTTDPGVAALFARSFAAHDVALSAPLAGSGSEVVAVLPFVRTAQSTRPVGFVAARLDVAELLHAALAEGAGRYVLVEIEDEAAPAGLGTLFRSPSFGDGGQPEYRKSLSRGQRAWTVACRPARGFPTATPWRPWALLGAGLLVSLLLAQTVASTTSRTRIRRLVQDQALELERSNRSVEESLEERLRIEAARRKLELQLRQIIDLVPHMIFAVDDKGRFLLVNKAAARALGGTVEELTGKDEVEAAGPRAWRERAREPERAVIEESRPQLIPVDTFVDASGEHRLLHVVKIPYSVSVDDRPAVLCVAVDVTERVHAEELHEQQCRVLTELAKGEPLDRVLTSLVTSIEELVPGMSASVLLVDPAGECLRHGAAPSLPGEYNAAVDGLPIGPTQGSCGAAAFLKESVIVEDIELHPNWAPYRELARKAGVRACWSQPILDARGEVLGTLAMYYREPRRPQRFELEMSANLAKLAGIAIERFRAVEEGRPRGPRVISG